LIEEEFIINEISTNKIYNNRGGITKGKKPKNNSEESTRNKKSRAYETFLTIEENQEPPKLFEHEYIREMENLDISQITIRDKAIKRNNKLQNSSSVKNSKTTTLQSNFTENFLTTKTHTQSSLSNQSGLMSIGGNEKKESDDEFSNKMIQGKSGKIEKEYIINNIETIYGQLEKTSPIISFLLVILFLISTISFSAFWSLGYLISELKTTFYCFDHHVGEFLICQQNEFCANVKKGVMNLMFLDEPEISSIDFEIEKQNINKFFRPLVMYDQVRFSAWNRMKNHKTVETMSDYKTVIGVSKNENFNIFSKYNLICNFQTTMLHMGMSFIAGLALFGVLFGCLADIFGRKKILSMLIILQILGFAVLFGFDFLLEREANFFEEVEIAIDSNNVFQKTLWDKIGDDYPKKFYNNKTQIDNNTFVINGTTIHITSEIYVEKAKYDPAKFSPEKPMIAENYLRTDKIDFLTTRDNKFSFNISQFDQVFQKKFFYMEKAKNATFMRRKFFFENRAFFMVGFSLAFSTMPSIFSLCLTYYMELSLNVSSTITNYKFLTKSYIVAYILSYYLNVLLNSYALTLLVYACLQFAFLIIFRYINTESPRFCYEVSDWIQLTDIIKTKFLDEREEQLNQKILKKIVRSKDDPVFKQEILHEKLNRWQQFEQNVHKCILTYNIFRDHSVIEKKINNEQKSKIEFKNFIKYPFLMSSLIYRSKHYKDISYLIYSMVFNLAIVIFLIQSKFFNEIFVSRDMLYGKDIVNFTVLKNFGMMLVSNYLFLFLDQIWGYPIIMGLCYFFIFVFSLLHGLETINYFVASHMKNNNYLLSIDYAKIQIFFFRSLTLFNSFFIHGLYFPLFLYLTNHSRTVYRATYFGSFNLIFYSFFLISIGLEKYFETSYFFICICCLVGFLISYFVKQPDNERIVKDFRILEKRNN